MLWTPVAAQSNKYRNAIGALFGGMLQRQTTMLAREAKLSIWALVSEPGFFDPFQQI